MNNYEYVYALHYVNELKRNIPVPTGVDCLGRTSYGILADIENEIIAAVEHQAKAELSKKADINKRRGQIIYKMLKELKTRVLDNVGEENAANVKEWKLTEPWVDSRGGVCATDLFRAFRFITPCICAERTLPMDTPDDLDKIWNTRYDKCIGVLPLPPVHKVKAHIEIEKGRRGRKYDSVICYDFPGENKPTVDAFYLLDLMLAFPDMHRLKYNPDNVFFPLFAESVDGQALLMPMRKNTEEYV